MDSLTQIILGAAAGEVVLGKKIGNRAMLWGAVGGTIPDLDVVGGMFLSNINNLAFHRGISHSITFSIIGAIVFGWMVNQIYNSPYHKWIAMFFKTAATILVGFAIIYVCNIFFTGKIVPMITVVIGLCSLLYFNFKSNYFNTLWEKPEASVRDWQWLFFWSLFTHPLLDCFTTYGTQLFAPFSDKRIAFSTVSVVDPIYTVPFLICLLIASRYSKNNNKRRVFNTLGIAWSSAYLLFTVINKQLINKTFAEAIKKQNIPVERFITEPLIFNNIVWNCTIETKDYFYQGNYSLLDKEEISFTKIAKNHHLLKNIDSDYTLKTLRWFCNDFYSVIPVGNKFQFNDLRFGTLTGKSKNPDDFVFKFLLTDMGKNGYYMEDVVKGPPKGKTKDSFKILWKRIKGEKE